jgi:hypothetical protein
MRVVFGLLFVVIAIFSFSFAAVKINKEIHQEPIQSNFQLSTFTSAVCNENNGFVNCKDELFVDCNGKFSRADEIEGCNGFNLDKSKLTGFAVFEKEWKDPRINQ